MYLRVLYCVPCGSHSKMHLHVICSIVLSQDSHKLLVIGTTSLDDDVLGAMRIRSAFNSTLEVPLLTSGAEVVALLRVSSGNVVNVIVCKHSSVLHLVQLSRRTSFYTVAMQFL